MGDQSAAATPGNPGDPPLPRRFAVNSRLPLPAELLSDRRPWYAIVSSRLSRNPLADRVALATLHHWNEQAIRTTSALPLVVAGTAAAPWVKRSCRLLGVEPVRLRLDGDNAQRGGDADDFADAYPLRSLAPDFDRDSIAFLLADRIDVATVRRNGTIHRLARQRLADDPSPTVRVRVPVEPWGQSAAAAEVRVLVELIAAGAVGYCCHWEDEAAEYPESADDRTDRHDGGVAVAKVARRLIECPEEWLVHCTRARSGPWPGQSEAQFRDWLLLSRPAPTDLTPLATLSRIVRQRQIVGTRQTVRSDRPVICFSAKAVLEATRTRVFRPHLGRWDGEPYGIAIRSAAAQRAGAMPVIYVDAESMPDVAVDQLWRVQAKGQTYDWTQENEWRIAGTLDLRRCDPDDVVVFVRSDAECRHFMDAAWPVVSIESLTRLAAET